MQSSDDWQIRPDRPDGWNTPQLTRYFENMWSNSVATFANKEESHRLCRIDDVIHEVIKDWRGHSPTIETIVPLLMFFRAHSAFRAASALGMAGGVVEGMAVLRLSLEFSGYSALVAQNSDLAQKWWDRDLDSKSKRAVLRAFTNAAVKDAIAKYDSKTSNAYEELYDRTIQFGAHPNEKAITSNFRLERGIKETKIDQVYLQGDTKTLDHWLRTANQVGICILKIFSHIHVKRFEKLKIREKMAPLIRGL